MNFLDIASIVVLIAYGRSGYKKGFITVTCDLIAFLGGILVALKFASTAGMFIESQLGVNETLAALIGFALIWVCIFAVVGFFGGGLNKMLSVSVLKPINRIGGLFLGVIKGMVVILPGLLILVFINAPIVSESTLISPIRYDLLHLMDRFVSQATQVIPETQFEQQRRADDDAYINNDYAGDDTDMDIEIPPHIKEILSKYDDFK